MPSIAGYSVTGWRGRIRPAVQTVDLEPAQPGVDGHVASVGAYRAEPVEIITAVDLNDLETTTTMINNYRRLVGTSVTVIDPYPISWPGVFIANMVPDWDKLISGGYRLTATWTLVPQSVNPP